MIGYSASYSLPKYVHIKENTPLTESEYNAFCNDLEFQRQWFRRWGDPVTLFDLFMLLKAWKQQQESNNPDIGV